MTSLGVRVFTVCTATFGALWGLVTVGTLIGVVVGATTTGVVGYFIWDSMRLRDVP